MCLSSASRVLPVCLQFEFRQLHPESKCRLTVPQAARSSKVRSFHFSFSIYKSHGVFDVHLLLCGYCQKHKGGIWQSPPSRKGQGKARRDSATMSWTVDSEPGHKRRKVNNEGAYCHTAQHQSYRELLPMGWFYQVVGMYFFLLHLFITKQKRFTFALSLL